MGGERGVDEQDLFASLWMGKHHRVFSGRVLRGHRVTFFAWQLGAKGLLGTVLGIQAIDPLLDAFGQLFVGHHHVGKQRIAAGLRTQFAAQYRTAGRRLLVGDIGMPEVFATSLFHIALGLARIEIAVQHQQLVRLRMARRQGMGFQFAELRGEVLLLHWSDVLVAKEQHFVLEPQLPDLRDQFWILGSVDKADVAELGADGGCAKLYLDRMLSHRRPDDGRCRGRCW
ncbi:hypothetical protein D3C81_1031750 [compost metagenome]